MKKLPLLLLLLIPAIPVSGADNAKKADRVVRNVQTALNEPEVKKHISDHVNGIADLVLTTMSWKDRASGLQIVRVYIGGKTEDPEMDGTIWECELKFSPAGKMTEKKCVFTD